MGFLSKKKLNTDWAVEEYERAVHIRRKTRRRRTQQSGRTARSNKWTNPREWLKLIVRRIAIMVY